MCIVEIDERGRMTIPRKMGIRKTRAAITPARSFFITIPLSKNFPREAESRLATAKERKELKVKAEKLAREDVVNEAKGDTSLRR